MGGDGGLMVLGVGAKSPESYTKNYCWVNIEFPT